MKQLVVDTDVISYIFKWHPLAGHYVDLLTDKEPVISFTTLEEMRFGALEANWGVPKRNLFKQYLSEFAVCYPDDGLCSLWAEVTHESNRKGHPISTPDAWIAATARYLDSPLVTHNSKHYSHLKDLVLLD